MTQLIGEAVGRVRLATPADEEELMAQCRVLYEENAIDGLRINEDRVRQMLRRAFDRQGMIVGIMGEPGKLEASIALLISQLWYSDDLILEELWNHVLPQYRRSTNATDMITFAQKCADSSGLPLLIGIVSNDKTAPKIRLYQRRLGTQTGAFWLYGRSTKKRA